MRLELVLVLILEFLPLLHMFSIDGLGISFVLLLHNNVDFFGTLLLLYNLLKQLVCCSCRILQDMEYVRDSLFYNVNICVYWDWCGIGY